MITLKREGTVLNITISGQLLISNVYELTDALTHYADLCNEYYLNLQDVTLVSDGGLTILLMFANHALRHGHDVRLTECSTAVSQRIAQTPLLQALRQAPDNTNPVHPGLTPFPQQQTHCTPCQTENDKSAQIYNAWHMT